MFETKQTRRRLAGASILAISIAAIAAVITPQPAEASVTFAFHTNGGKNISTRCERNTNWTFKDNTYSLSVNDNTTIFMPTYSGVELTGFSGGGSRSIIGEGIPYYKTDKISAEALAKIKDKLQTRPFVFVRENYMPSDFWVMSPTTIANDAALQKHVHTYGAQCIIAQGVQTPACRESDNSALEAYSSFQDRGYCL